MQNFTRNKSLISKRRRRKVKTNLDNVWFIYVYQCCFFEMQKKAGCTNAAFLRCRKKQDELGTLTMVIGNTWVILLIMLTLPWLIPVCYLILNHQLLKKSHHGVATTRELCTPVKLITLSAVDMAVPLLWNTKHFIPWKKKWKKRNHRHQTK